MASTEENAALIRRGRADAHKWLAAPHEQGLWDTGPLADDADRARLAGPSSKD